MARLWLSGEEKGISLAANCLSVDVSVHCLTTVNMPLWDGKERWEGERRREEGREGERGREREEGREEERGGRGKDRHRIF